MRAVLTRVKSASVKRTGSGEILGEIGKGFLILLGVHADDTEREADRIADRICGLRVFEDISYPDSMGRAFYAIPDGSYLLIRDGEETIRGEAYRIAEGKLEQIAKAEEIYAISSENTY